MTRIGVGRVLTGVLQFFEFKKGTFDLGFDLICFLMEPSIWS
jgi:hypothetical protein